jgi:hypothetical protein
MKSLKKDLLKYKIPAITPTEESDKILKSTKNDFLIFKKEVSKENFKLIRKSKVYGILVVNSPKKNIVNYIGANTFAEIAIAFNARKKIFLLYDIFKVFEDELLAWGAMPLYNDMNVLINTYMKDVKKSSTSLPEKQKKLEDY